MTQPTKFSSKSRLGSFINATRGIKFLLVTQPNVWLHSLATLTVCVAGLLLRLSNTEWCFLVLCFVSVWTTEALNTALEVLTDIVSPDFHPLAGRAKDVAAGAVLIAALGSVIVGAIVFVPHILRLATQ